jgi:hypothetical protein
MLLSAAWGVATIVRIYAFLQGRGQEVSFILLRLMTFEHVGKYRRITKAELGWPGPLYMQSVTAWLIALGAAISAGVIPAWTS